MNKPTATTTTDRAQKISDHNNIGRRRELAAQIFVKLIGAPGEGMTIRERATKAIVRADVFLAAMDQAERMTKGGNHE